MSNLQQQRLVTEQLRREAAIKRITVRQAVADIMVMKRKRNSFIIIQYLILYISHCRNMLQTISRMIV